MGTQTASLPLEQEELANRPLERGACLGSYELVLPLASGGMGRVWIAAKRGDFGFTRMFAVKVMREDIAEREVFRRMFLAEAKLAARLRHTNVVEVFDLGEAEGTVYQAMELVDGDSLIGLIRGASTPMVEAEIAGRILVDVLRGLHAAHELRDEHGAPLELVHRDVSPHNILVGLDGVAKIADFGVARVTGLLGIDTSGPVGKRAYMAPEQLRAEAIDRRCDVFSSGVVLYELLAGKRPDLLSPAMPEQTSGDARAAESFAKIALRAIAPDPADRYPSADAMADALEEAAMRAGVTLSTKRVQSWVGALVGSRISRQRAEARREFEQSRFVPKTSPATDTTTTPDQSQTRPLPEPPPSSPALYPMIAQVAAPPPARPRGVLLVAIAGAVLAGLVTSAAVIAYLARPFAPAPSAMSSASASIPAAAPPPSVSIPEPAEPAPTASAEAPRPAPVSSAPPRRPIPKAPAGKSSTPSLPYDNPYKR